MTLRNSLISFLLMTAMGLSFWSMFLSSQTTPVLSENTSDQPDAFMENVSALILDKQGKPHLKIETPKMIHYADNDTTELVKPHVVIYRQSPQPWHINANHAKATLGTSEITFWDDVIIHHFTDNDNLLTTLQTSSLTILPDQQLAKTNEAVTLTQPDTKIDAIGMLANWDAGTVKLLSKAREEYVPKS